MTATKRDIVEIVAEHLQKQQLSQYRISLLLAGMVQDSLQTTWSLLSSGELARAKQELESCYEAVREVSDKLKRRLCQPSRPVS